MSRRETSADQRRRVGMVVVSDRKRVSKRGKSPPLSDVSEARRLFKRAGLAFPTIPDELAPRLKKKDDWLFSTREITVSPYFLRDYVLESATPDLQDYAVLSHSGHGINSYAVQYYLVFGSLRMFLHLAWDGAYTDAKAAAGNIRNCFSLADEIVLAVRTAPSLQAGDRLTIVGADFLESYWSAPRVSGITSDLNFIPPAVVLTEALEWLTKGG